MAFFRYKSSKTRSNQRYEFTNFLGGTLLKRMFANIERHVISEHSDT